jgi:hypothetical protein
MRLIRVLLIGVMLQAIIGGGVLAGEKQNPKIDFTKIAVVSPFDSSVTEEDASLLTETMREIVIAHLQKASLFSAVVTSEEAKDWNKAILIEITGKLTKFKQAHSFVCAGFDIVIKDSATGNVLWNQSLGANIAPLLHPLSASQRSKLPEKVAKEFVKQLSFSAIKAISQELYHSQIYYSAVGMIIPGKLACKDLSGVSGAGGTAMGGEFRISKRFALGGEFQILYSTNSECFSENEGGFDTASLSIGTSYHFARKLDPKTGVSLIQKVDPYLSIGALALEGGKGLGGFGQIYLGGGINYWAGSQTGFKLEFRDHALTIFDSKHATKVPAWHFIMSVQAGMCIRF